MKRDNRPWRALEPASLAWTADGEPVSNTYGDVYFSRGDGPAESVHVFLEGNGLPARWQDHPRAHFCVGETGFGTGLNFLLTWRAWREAPGPKPDLHYLSLEKHPLSRGDLARALARWAEFDNFAQPLLQAYPGLLPGEHRLLLDGGRVRLDLWWEDATVVLLDLASRGEPLVDAWYLDGFAPDRNPDMWSKALLDATAALSRPAATVATFSAAGHVRRKLAEAGFRVERAPGHGRKRECLRGRLDAAGAAGTGEQPGQNWDLPAAGSARPETAIVLGGGLAGCAAAAALARRGIAVSLLERGAVAGAGSAMEQGIIYTRLSRRHSALADFALLSFQFATHFYRTLFANGELVTGDDGELCGSFQQSGNTRDRHALREALAGLEDVAQVLDAGQASALLGVTQPREGFWFPGSGWLRPAALCRALLRHPGIQPLEHAGKVSLEHTGSRWRAIAGGATLAEADCAIAAPGSGVRSLQQLDWLPVQAIRGQVTHLPTNSHLEPLRAALCHEGYIAPARAGSHCIGATFEPGSGDSALRTVDHRHNLDRLAAAVPACRETLAALDHTTLAGRVGYRCASPDYLPLVGPVPDLPAFLEAFGALRRNARQPIAHRGSYLPGLWLTTAHGSRGLTSTPLAAELLASLICGEAPPLNRALCRALAPARFIIRDLTRNRI